MDESCSQLLYLISSICLLSFCFSLAFNEFNVWLLLIFISVGIAGLLYGMSIVAL